MAEQSRILVVEGEENLNWNIVNSLQKDGYIVLGVTGGAEAIRTLWSEEYDVVVCSQQMPDADGFDLLQWMRTYCPNTRMVMLGVSGGGISRTQALEMGVAGYLEKPLDLRALKEELRRLLHQTGFSASLDSFDLLDVIQIITMSRKSIALVVSTGLEEQGILRFQSGELIWAEYGTLRGEEAFFALAAHKNGTVVHRPWSDQVMPNVTQPLSRLIFQALQYRSKYADYQQLSNELEAVKPNNSSPLSSPLPSTTFTTTLDDMEEDDRPFQFVAEDFSAGGQRVGVPYEQLVRGSSTNGRMEQVGTTRNLEAGVPEEDQKAWWEPTGSYPSLRASGSMRAVTDGEPGKAFATDGVSITPSTVHKTALGQNSGLPSWLTDQPTHLDLPVLRGSTGQMPAMPQERSPAPPNTPPVVSSLPPTSPGLPANVSAEWPEMSRPTGLNPAESGLRKINPEESMFTTPHRAVKPNGNQAIGSLRPAPAEWQSPVPDSALPNGQSGRVGGIKLPPFTEHTGDTLQSLAALKKPAVASPVDTSSGKNSAVSAMPAQRASEPVWAEPGTAGKRNYPALTAALQTVGYSVAGFIASAVVGLDGKPIAQVTVDDVDISPQCAHFGHVVQGVLHATKQGGEEEYEHIVITSRTQYILCRMLGKKKDLFQVLITSRETTPQESLDVMANVETALVAAL